MKTDQRKAEEEEKWRENKATAKMGDCVKTDQRKAEEEEKWRENKATAKMGGLCEDRSKKGRGGRKVERKQGYS